MERIHKFRSIISRNLRNRLARQETLRQSAKAMMLYRIAITRKLRTRLSGRSRIPSSCQIKDILKKYEQLSLDPRNGVFVEVGGFDGETYSNTSFLADQGWRGVYVEPIPMFCAHIRRRHLFNPVVVECAAVGTTDGTTMLKVMGHLSTLHMETFETMRDIDWASDLAETAKEIIVKTRRIDDILERNAVPKSFDLMIVDVEGGEDAVIIPLLQSKWRPRVLIVELCDVNPSFEINEFLVSNHKYLRETILSYGYSEFHVDQTNTIFQHQAT
ncbi:MAG: FkbM family methyltransferase [Pseudomonadota bacterium]